MYIALLVLLLLCVVLLYRCICSITLLELVCTLVVCCLITIVYELSCRRTPPSNHVLYHDVWITYVFELLLVIFECYMIVSNIRITVILFMCGLLMYSNYC